MNHENLNGILLRSGKWEAEVLPSFGANLISLKYEGHAILRTPENRNQLESAPELFGNPILFPPNRTKDGKFLFQGQEYRLPINEAGNHNHLHGRVHRTPFEVVYVSECAACCRLKNAGDWFPFPFTMEASFELTDTGLLQRVSLQNCGASAMPVLLGFHTSFVPAYFSVPIGKRWERDDRFIPTGELADLNAQELSFQSGAFSVGKTISGYYTAEGGCAHIGRIAFGCSPEFTQWILYNGQGSGELLCVEPQTGCVNGLNIPGEHRILPAGESVSFWLSFTVS